MESQKKPQLKPISFLLPQGTRFIFMAELDPEKVFEYRRKIKQGFPMPPVRVVNYEDAMMICDGHHRIMAYRMELMPIPACVVDGETFEDLDLYLRQTGDPRRACDPEFWK